MRDYLFPTEIDRLLKASGKSSRHGVRNKLMVLLAYRHGLRISEAVDLRLSDLDMQSARINA